MSSGRHDETQNATPKRFFTIDEANAMLPLVRAITADLVELARDLIERRQRLALLTGGRHIDGDDLYSQELVQVQGEIEQEIERLQGYAEELRQLGVELKDAPEGIVDFPSLLDGRVVLLCWKHGEPEVLHWHEVDAGIAGRQPIFAQVASDSEIAGEDLP